MYLFYTLIVVKEIFDSWSAAHQVMPGSIIQGKGERLSYPGGYNAFAARIENTWDKQPVTPAVIVEPSTTRVISFVPIVAIYFRVDQPEQCQSSPTRLP